jgi:hypothetical protein
MTGERTFGASVRSSTSTGEMVGRGRYNEANYMRALEGTNSPIAKKRLRATSGCTATPDEPQ